MSATPVTVLLEERELAALDHSIRNAKPALTREQALSKIVAAWAAAHPASGRAEVDEGMRPDELNASNDT